MAKKETILTREELFSDILAARPSADDLVYIERRGKDYAWSRTRLDAYAPAVHSGGALPDVWIYYAGQWPEDDDLDRWRAFFDDLLAEMESMAGGADRCRWPLDDPWPHRH